MKCLLDKRGQLFSIYLVLIVIFMIGVVLGFYYFQGLQYETTASSIVSSKPVLDFRDDLEIYSYLEEDYMINALGNSKGDFGSVEFRGSFRDNFLRAMESDSFIKEFLVKDLVIEGRNVEDLARVDYSDFLKNTLYPANLIYFESDKLIVERIIIGKSRTLYAQEDNKINFPVDFKVKFKEKYLISFEDNKYSIIRGE